MTSVIFFFLSSYPTLTLLLSNYFVSVKQKQQFLGHSRRGLIKIQAMTNHPSTCHLFMASWQYGDFNSKSYKLMFWCFTSWFKVNCKRTPAAGCQARNQNPGRGRSASLGALRFISICVELFDTLARALTVWQAGTGAHKRSPQGEEAGRCCNKVNSSITVLESVLRKCA